MAYSNHPGGKKYNSKKRLEQIEANRLIRIATRRHNRWKHLVTPKNQEKKLIELRRAKFFKVRVLSSRQLKGIQLMSDFMNCWSPDYIAGQCGVSIAHLYKWRNDPFFMKELNQEITRRKTMMRLEAYKQLFKAVRRGKPMLLLAYLKMTGDFAEKIEVKDTTNEVKKESDLDAEIQMLQDELGISKSA